MKYLISIYMSANGYNVFCEKRMEIGDRMKRAPMGFFSEQNLGMINTALSSATTELENFSMVAVENMVGGIIQAVCVMIVLLFFNWKVAITLTDWLAFIICYTQTDKDPDDKTGSSTGSISRNNGHKSA